MAAGSTYTPIATTTLGSAAASYTFSSIPSTYTDLVLVTSANTTNTGFTEAYYRFNSDTGSNYSRVGLFGNGSSVGSFISSGITQGLYTYLNGTTIGSNVYSFNSLNIQNYSNSTTYKTTLCRTASIGDSAIAVVNLWRSTSAITSIFLAPTSGSFNTGSTFTLYGIAAA